MMRKNQSLASTLLAFLFVSLPCAAQTLNLFDRYESNLASGYTSGGTSLSVASASGLPTGATYFFAIVKAEGANTEEVFLVSNVSGTTLTVTGAQAGTSASNHATGATIIAPIMTSAAFTKVLLEDSPPSNSATTYYVATTGSDSNVCSSSSKCLTLAHVLGLIPTLVTKPYTVNIADGTYAEAIDLSGFVTSLQGIIAIVGNTTTPANVVFSGTTSVTLPDSVGSYTVGAFVPCYAKLSGLKLSGSGTSRSLFVYGGNLQIDNITVAANATVAGIQASLRGTATFTGTNTITTFQSGAFGLYANQASYLGQYGGSITITGPGGNNTSTGLNIQSNSVFDMHQGTTATLTISAVQTGVFGGRGAQFINLVSTATPSVSLTNSSTPTSSTGIYMSNGSVYTSNPGALTITNWTTCYVTDGGSSIIQKSATESGCGTRASPAVNCSAFVGSGSVCVF